MFFALFTVPTANFHYVTECSSLVVMDTADHNENSMFDSVMVCQLTER